MEYARGTVTEREARRTARRRAWRRAQYAGLVLLAAAAGTLCYLALFHRF